MKYVSSSLILLCLLFSVSVKSASPPFVQDTTTVSNNEIFYKVTQDQSHLYLNISTSDTKTIMSMLHFGVSVFFDIKGKKKENVSVTYPLGLIKSNSKGSKNVREDLKVSEEEKAVKQRIVRVFEKELPNEAVYHYFNSRETFNVLLNSLDITAFYTYDQGEGLLEYDLKIPINKINTDSKKDLRKLTIGVKTVKKEQHQKNTERPQGSMGGGSGGSSGRPSGGQGSRPSGGGQGAQGGQKGGPQSSNKKMKPTDVELDFWFAANLFQEN
jgi:hypothetical protein